MKFLATVDGKDLTFNIHRSDTTVTLERDGSKEQLDLVRVTPYSYSILVGGKSHYLSITEHPEGFKVVIDQHAYEVQIRDEKRLLVEQSEIGDRSGDTHGEVRAPIPGLVSALFVQPGQTVKKGDRIVILEAMKMENEIQSVVSGTVQEVAVSRGQSVEKDALLVSILTGSHVDR